MGGWARLDAVLALNKIVESGARSDAELSKRLDSPDLSKEDRAFLTSLVYGCLQKLSILDDVIAEFSSIKLEKLSLSVKNILRTAIYQDIFMDKVPKYAIVDEAIKITKKLSNKGAAGFVNAVLRAYMRKGYKRDEKSFKSEFERLLYEHSIPRWMGETFINSYGETAALAVLAHIDDEDGFIASLNTILGGQEELVSEMAKELQVSPESWPKNCVKIERGGSFLQSKSFKEGLFHIQDKGSMLAVEALSLKEGEKVLDVCAAPGGKSLRASQLMNNKGRILSLDLSVKKTEMIKEAAKRLSASIIEARTMDAAVYNPDFDSAFDAVICDVPCSGLGTIAKKPDVRLKNAGDVKSLIPVQREILQNSSRYVRPGGRILYSTCTLSHAENESAVADFLNKNPDFSPVSLKSLFQGYGIFMNDEYMPTLFPGIHGCGGFFMCVMARKDI